MPDSRRETWAQMSRRHETERAQLVRMAMGGSMQEAADILGIEKHTLDSYLRYRGLRWSAEQIEAAYPEIKDVRKEAAEVRAARATSNLTTKSSFKERAA